MYLQKAWLQGITDYNDNGPGGFNPDSHPELVGPDRLRYQDGFFTAAATEVKESLMAVINRDPAASEIEK